MNTRIKELIVRLEPDAFMTYKGYLYHSSDPKVLEHSDPEPLYTRQELEKLIELTVKECVQFIHEENVRLREYQNSLPEWDGNKRDDCDLVIEKCIDLAERLKQHFGVEE
jgi:hypothetical protein